MDVQILQIVVFHIKHLNNVLLMIRVINVFGKNQQKVVI